MAASEKSSPCAVCEARGNAKVPSAARLSRVTIEGRTIVLCRDHAGLVAIRMPKTWDELRSIFRPPSDKRSPIVRRRPDGDDRRVFPPRPEGRRARAGRRSTDPML
jgi:hypothetical protein